jgi:photosystem II stability/assembly factor-like uncharacterized protein
MAEASTTGGRLHNNLGNRNLPGQHTSESVGVLSPSSINPNDIGKNWTDLGVISTAGAILRGASSLGNGIAIIGDANGRLYRSFDSGQTWTNQGIIRDLIVDSSTIFASSYMGNGIILFGDINGNLFRSTDFGLTWSLVIAAGSLNSIFASAYVGNGIILVGSVDGRVSRSTTFGIFGSWITFAVTPGFIDSITYLDNGIVILTDNQGHIFRSTSFGVTGTWTDIGDFSTSSMLGSVYLGNGVVLTSDGLGHIFRSTDFGINWTDIGSQSNGGSAIQTLSYLGNGLVIFGDFNGHIFKSSDYGVSWTDMGAISGTVIRTIVNCNGTIVIGDNNGHIFVNDISNKTDEARSTVHSDLLNRNLTGISTHNSELVGTLSPYSLNHNDIGGTVGATTGNWNVTTATGVAIICIENIGSGIIFAGATNGHIYRSTDFGKTFTDFITLAAVPINVIRYFGNGIVIAGDNLGNYYSSADFGNSWLGATFVPAFTGITIITFFGHGVANIFDGTGSKRRTTDYGASGFAIGAALTSPNTEAYLDNGISVVGENNGHIQRSTNFGSSYTDLGTVGTVPSTGLRCSSYLGNGIVIMGDNNGHIYRSTDFGANWTDLGDITGSQIVITSAYLGNGVAIVGVVAGVAGKIFKSTDYGLTWTDLTPGLFVSGTFFNTLTAKYLGNGVSLIADNAGNIIRNDVGSMSHINEEFIQDIEKPIRTMTSSELLEKDDDTLLVDATAANITIFLPSISAIPGHVYHFIRVDATLNTVTINPAGAETINLALTQPLNVQFLALSIKAKPYAPNAGWWIF